MKELELYKLCFTNDNDYGSCMVDELGWVNDDQFCVWVPYYYIEKFIDTLRKLFGCGIFDDGSFNANMQSYGVCIDLCEALGNCIDLENMFPKDEYKH